MAVHDIDGWTVRTWVEHADTGEVEPYDAEKHEMDILGTHLKNMVMRYGEDVVNQFESAPKVKKPRFTVKGTDVIRNY
jgi:hypothetical protein